MICTGNVPGADGSGAGAGIGTGAEVGGATARGAMGVFSLFVSCDDVVLGGLVGEDGRGGRKFSVSSESEGGGCGIDEGMTTGAGEGRFGIGNSSCAICIHVSIRHGSVQVRHARKPSYLVYPRDDSRQQGRPNRTIARVVSDEAVEAWSWAY